MFVYASAYDAVKTLQNSLAVSFVISILKESNYVENKLFVCLVAVFVKINALKFNEPSFYFELRCVHYGILIEQTGRLGTKFNFLDEVSAFLY